MYTQQTFFLERKKKRDSFQFTSILHLFLFRPVRFIHLFIKSVSSQLLHQSSFLQKMVPVASIQKMKLVHASAHHGEVYVLGRDGHFVVKKDLKVFVVNSLGQVVYKQEGERTTQYHFSTDNKTKVRWRKGMSR